MPCTKLRAKDRRSVARKSGCVVNVTNRGLTDNHRDSTRGPNAAGHTRSFRTDTDTRELLTK